MFRPEPHNVASPVHVAATSDASPVHVAATSVAVPEHTGHAASSAADENLRLKKRRAFEEQQNAKLRQSSEL